MDDDEIWRMEEQFWIGGEARYRSALDPECIMGFPAPIGIMVGKAILESLAQAPRWSSVEISECQIARPAVAQRDAGQSPQILDHSQRDGMWSFMPPLVCGLFKQAY